jgi:lambda repressor-like predicted transcriptional regulator
VIRYSVRRGGTRGGIALAKDALRNGDWTEVARVVEARLKRLKMSLAYLAQETGLSPNTIRQLGTPAGKHNQSTLVALSAVLGWRHDHLLNIVLRQPEKNVLGPEDSPLEAHFANVLHAEVGPIKVEMAELKDIVGDMGRKIDVMYQTRQSTDTGKPT